MSEPDFIRLYWDSQAQKHGKSAAASWGDHFMVDLEVAEVASRLPAGGRVLDVGCANGHATLRHAQRGVARSITGVDYSEAMIAAAQLAKAEASPQADVTFEQGDVRSLQFGAGTFDLTYTTRTLINLPTWEDQMRGIGECLRVTRKGGTVLLLEAFWEPLVLLNALRSLKQLPPLVEHDFNRYLKRSKLGDWLQAEHVQHEFVDFSSIYYLGSRFLRELVTDAASYPGYDNPINRIFCEIEKQFSGGGFGIQQAVVITK